MFAQAAVGRNLERGFDPVRRRFHRDERDAGREEDDFLRVVETLTCEADFEFRAALSTGRKDVSEAWRNGVSGG